MKQSDLTKEEFLQECLKLLDHFDKDYSRDTITLNSGDNSIIMNSKSPFFELFGGYSIWGVCEFVAKELNKKIEWEDESY
jgi:hypothetical protein